jgi:hypothetical protein
MIKLKEEDNAGLELAKKAKFKKLKQWSNIIINK